ncbi:MAG: hypothetical protein LBC33_00160 [Mycoplasmataceae bacterium]|nr:hypothetical protein [Mycoplasmataceae bacterium]
MKVLGWFRKINDTLHSSTFWKNFGICTLFATIVGAPIISITAWLLSVHPQPLSAQTIANNLILPDENHVDEKWAQNTANNLTTVFTRNGLNEANEVIDKIMAMKKLHHTNNICKFNN